LKSGDLLSLADAWNRSRSGALWAAPRRTALPHASLNPRSRATAKDALLMDTPPRGAAVGHVVGFARTVWEDSRLRQLGGDALRGRGDPSNSAAVRNGEAAAARSPRNKHQPWQVCAFCTVARPR